MAIYLTDKDGSDQHFDTYAEFEQAMVLMSRIGGNKVPQDLLDEVSAKYGEKDTEPLQVKIDGNNFESAFREAIRDVGEELDRLSKDRAPISDEVEDSPTEFQDGDLVVIKESFRDSFGDVAERSSILPVITDGLYAVIGVGTVLIGDNLDKLQLVCRREDRKDVEL